MTWGPCAVSAKGNNHFFMILSIWGSKRYSTLNWVSDCLLFRGTCYLNGKNMEELVVKLAYIMLCTFWAGLCVLNKLGLCVDICDLPFTDGILCSTFVDMSSAFYGFISYPVPICSVFTPSISRYTIASAPLSLWYSFYVQRCFITMIHCICFNTPLAFGRVGGCSVRRLWSKCRVLFYGILSVESKLFIAYSSNIHVNTCKICSLFSVFFSAAIVWSMCRICVTYRSESISMYCFFVLVCEKLQGVIIYQHYMWHCISSIPCLFSVS